MQRWALLLATYQYNIEFRSTHEHSNADGLSPLPLAAKEGQSVSTISVFSLSQIEFLPMKADKLRQTTNHDPELSKALLYTQRGWPRQVDKNLKPFSNGQSELSVEAGCLLWGMRVVVPEAC